MYYLGVDPGKDKAGLAVVNQNLELVKGVLIQAKDFEAEVKRLQKEYECEKILLGNGTSHECFFNIINKVFSKCEIVDERNSSLAARKEYWNNNPPRGIKRLIPTSLQTPPRAVDDYAAFIIVLRYLQT